MMPDSESAKNTVADTEVATDAAAETRTQPPRRRFGLRWSAPAWLVSLCVHLGILMAMALVTFTDPQKIINVLSATSDAETAEEIEEFTVESFDAGELQELDELSASVDVPEPVEASEAISMDTPMEFAATPLEMSDLATQLAPQSMTLQTLASTQSTALEGRSTDMKKKLLRQYGGNAASETAVTEAIKWMANHQMPNGGWTLQHDLVCRGQCGNAGDPKRADAVNAATALAILPFLGAGQTHLQGDFRSVVRRGLFFLIKNGKPGMIQGMPVVDYSEVGGNQMYSHGLAAIALCEAYAMTGDRRLADAAQGAINFIVAAQGGDGGWRYGVRQPEGDTSVFGWQVMALKSGYMGHLVVPPASVASSIRFLDKVQSQAGAHYGYTTPESPANAACTAVGLLCRMYTGWDKNHPALREGVRTLAKIGVLEEDIYFNYYAAQVLRHVGGPEWDKFNGELRDSLVKLQSQEGHAKGSWYFHNDHMDPGGRLVVTSFATMILEVYYRHMPLYSEKTEEDEFPL